MNIGVLGHVDSGKTSLVKVLSTTASTGAFDKNAASANLRANTIDLGISAVDVDDTRIALIDCPGHASLLRAVLAASSVFDAAIVVINAVRGIEPQTAEHLLLVSILCPDHVLVVINKTDLVPKERVEKFKAKLPKMLQSLSIAGTAPIVDVSLVDEKRQQEALDVVRNALRRLMYAPVRNASGHFAMTVDHAFPIKGKGTVLTGTVIDGIGRVGMTVHIPSCDETRKVKEIQSWKKSVQSVNVGERAALLVTNLEPDRCNRTVICEPGALTKIHQFMGTVKRIKQFHHQMRTRSKVHLSVGFEVVMAECQFLLPAADGSTTSEEYEWSDEMTEATSVVLLKLNQPVHSRVGALFLATKLDAQESTDCRIAFYGHVERNVEHEGELPIFRRKHREGTIERVENANSVICTGLFKKESDFSHFNDMQVHFSTGDVGRVEGAFGKQGKCRVAIPSGLQEDTLQQAKSGQPISVLLRMKKYLSSKKLVAY